MMFFFPLKNIFVGNHDNQSELTVFINSTHLRKKKDSISVSLQMRSLLLLTLTKFYLFNLVIVTQKNTLKISMYILTIQLTWAYHNTGKEEEWYVYHV